MKTKIISITKPMDEFCTYFANGLEVQRIVDMSKCTDFRPKGMNSEAIVYSGRQLAFCCCYTEYRNKFYITSVWSDLTCVYECDLSEVMGCE